MTRFRQKGFALLPCSLMLVVVLLALTASLRSARLQMDTMQANADLQIARIAAESSLAEGERRLRALFMSEAAVEGTLSASRFASSCAASDQPVSHYQMDLMWSDKHIALCRVTATGTGRRADVRFGVQAVYELADCVTTTGASLSAGPPVPASSEPASQAAPSCKRDVRLRSWRSLGEA